MKMKLLNLSEKGFENFNFQKKTSIIISFILISIVIISCSSSRNNREEIKLQKGTGGLEIEFLKNTPKEVFEEERLYVTFELRNEGFYDIQKGVLVPSIEKDFMEIDSWELPRNFRTEQKNLVSFDLNGKTLTNLKGEKQVVNMIIKAKNIDDTRNKLESRIVLNACYPYETILSETICIDTDPNDLLIAPKTCKVRDIISSGQGAPIVITKVEQKIIPGDSKDSVRVQFTIYAENRGDGIIIDQSRYKDICIGKSLSEDDYNVLKLKSLKFSDYVYEDGDIECSPSPLKETKDGYYTRCLLKEENSIPKGKLTFETPLVIELSYGYKTTISEEIYILNKDPKID